MKWRKLLHPWQFFRRRKPVIYVEPPPAQLTNDALSLTLWGLPLTIEPEQQQEIFNQVVEHTAQKYANCSYGAGEIIDTQEFTLRIQEQVYRVRYELKALQFLAALKVFQGAIKWIAEQPDMDNEVVRITSAHLIRQLKNEYSAIPKPIAKKPQTVNKGDAQPPIIDISSVSRKPDQSDDNPLASSR
jgi:hypothetical protein